MLFQMLYFLEIRPILVFNSLNNFCRSDDDVIETDNFHYMHTMCCHTFLEWYLLNILSEQQLLTHGIVDLIYRQLSAFC